MSNHHFGEQGFKSVSLFPTPYMFGVMLVSFIKHVTFIESGFNLFTFYFHLLRFWVNSLGKEKEKDYHNEFVKLCLKFWDFDRIFFLCKWHSSCMFSWTMFPSKVSFHHHIGALFLNDQILCCHSMLELSQSIYFNFTLDIFFCIS